MNLQLGESYKGSLFKKKREYFAKYEAIVNENMDLYANEILFRLNGHNSAHVCFLKELRVRNETFLLFTKICKKAFDDIKKNKGKVNINLEIQDLLNPLFLYFLDDLLVETGIDASRINFEILENDEITNENNDVVLSRLNILIKMGFKISIDDLFSGYSTKQRINFLLGNEIEVDMVKIEGKYIQDMYLSFKYGFYGLEHKRRFTVSDIDEFKKYIEELKSNGVKLVAEWVETKGIFEFTQEIGINLFQGYLFQDFKNEKIFKI